VVCAGNSIEVIYSGRCKGDLIVLMNFPPDHQDLYAYWRLNPAAEAIMFIGSEQVQLEQFKKAQAIR
jgi:hypothetical protein